MLPPSIIARFLSRGQAGQVNFLKLFSEGSVHIELNFQAEKFINVYACARVNSFVRELSSESHSSVFMNSPFIGRVLNNSLPP